MPLPRLPFLHPHKHHWKARALLNKEFKEIFIAEIISITIALFAGILIATYVDTIILIPGLLILLPGFLGMHSNITGALVARLGTALDLNDSVNDNRFAVYQNIFASFVLSVITAACLAVVAYAVTYFLFGLAYPKIFGIAIIATLLSNFAENLLAIPATFWLYKKGFDPTDIMGPYVAATGDVVGVLSLLAAIFIIL